MAQQNKYIISREDLFQDPVTIITEGLLIGRLKQCDLLLNHPSVSRAQAGIKEIDQKFYVFPLRSGNPVKLNGKPVEENEALAAGDLLEVGPFVLEIDSKEDALTIRVSLEIGVVPESSDVSSGSLVTSRLAENEAAGKKPKPRAAPLPANKALDIFWDKRIREAGKMMRHSSLFPRGQRRTGKAQFNWTPTTDLLSRWPIAIFVWGAVLIGVLSVAAAYWYTNAYAPGQLSTAHAKMKLDLVPPIAARPISGSCTSCHSLGAKMESKCAACHNAENFVATVIKPHEDAGIGCVSCHAEHRGADFKAATAALFTCFECHNDSNKVVYNGRRVGTPHGGTFGYPATEGKWTWMGLSDADWSLKKTPITRLPRETDEQWRSKQFHALHVQRVKAVAPLVGNQQGELSCSSCHKALNPIDRTTPRTTCGVCHNGKKEVGTDRVVIASDKPNCTSCHVQHVLDKRTGT
ncbi:MAG TPA: FHA domain-containing protein [Pyrinomonadaceae bacterium]